jgi:glyoxylase-like metal-dependent hydrolase (beta-lactamase superfamily II)
VSTSRYAWVEAGAHAVAPGVHRVPLPLPNDGLQAVNVYVVEAPDGLVLVDSGWALTEAREQLEKALAALGYGLADVHHFLVTHVHRDHYTQAVALRKTFGMRVSLGADEQESLRRIMKPSRHPIENRADEMRMFGGAELADELLANVPVTSPTQSSDYWDLPDDWLQDGQRIGIGDRALDVVSTPGHTVGHVVFVDDAGGLLFAGDHVLPQITPSISLEPANPANPLGDFLDSLALVRAMPDRKLLPAHGPATDSVHARVDELVAHHGLRLEQTEKAVSRGAHTAYEVAQQLAWTRREHRFADLDMFNRLMAVGETGAHLSLLVAQGRLVMTTTEGVQYYAVA